MGEAVFPSPSAGKHLPAFRAFPDALLARSAARGDARAFEAIYRRYRHSLYGYCLSILRHPDDARDALQNTMVSAMRGLPGGSVARLRPWLFRIAHNESVSVLRQRRDHEELSEEALAALPALDADPGTRARVRELLADIRRLPLRQRAALIMRELNGLAYEEIAAVFGVSANAVRQAVFEARLALHAEAEGRAASCEAIRRSLSDGDRRMLKGRRVRAHLRACAPCREFESTVARNISVCLTQPPIARRRRRSDTPRGRCRLRGQP